MHSIIEYPGTGTNGPFSLNFTSGFLSRSHVSAYIPGELDGSAQQVYRTIEWITDGLVNISGPAVAVGSSIVISRTTPIAYALNDYQDGAVLSEGNLDESFMQSVMLAQEAEDGKYFSAKLYSDLDANTHKIRNLDNPVLAGDAVPLGFIEYAIQSAVQSVINTTGSAQALFLEASPSDFDLSGYVNVVIVKIDNTSDCVSVTDSTPGVTVCRSEEPYILDVQDQCAHLIKNLNNWYRVA